MESLSLRGFYRDTFSPLFLRSRAERTRKLYETTLNNFERFLSRTAHLSDLNDDTVSRFLSWFRALPRAAPTVNKERANLLAIWRFACRKSLLLVWPDVDAEVEPERIPRAWLREDIARLFAACAREEGELCGVSAAAWWTALHYVCWDTGERIGAVRALRWDDVDLRCSQAVFRAESRKGGRRDHAYPLEGDTLQALRAIHRPSREAVFPWPYHPNYIYTRYKWILIRAGLPYDSKSKFHRIRKSVASHSEAAGGNATLLLDHSSRKVTRAYLDPRIVPQENPVEFLFRPDRG